MWLPGVKRAMSDTWWVFHYVSFVSRWYSSTQSPRWITPQRVTEKHWETWVKGRKTWRKWVEGGIWKKKNIAMKRIKIRCIKKFNNSSSEYSADSKVEICKEEFDVSSINKVSSGCFLVFIDFVWHSTNKCTHKCWSRKDQRIQDTMKTDTKEFQSRTIQINIFLYITLSKPMLPQARGHMFGRESVYGACPSVQPSSWVFVMINQLKTWMT